MKLADRDWLIFCSNCGEYTALNRFLPKRGHFQGEHSLALNAFLNSDLLLGKFLLHHAQHSLVAVPNLTDEYTRIISSQDRFLETLIDAIIEERLQQVQDQEQRAEALRREGYHTLLALRKLYEERARELESAAPPDPNQARVQLGKVLGIEWCKGQIDNLLDLGQVDQGRKAN